MASPPSSRRSTARSWRAAASTRTWQSDRHDSLGRGIYGWLDDGLATMAPWGFDLAAIEAPVLLVQGGQDLMVPEAHACGMAAVIPDATLEFLPEEGHMTLGMSPDRALDWLVPQLR